MSSKKPEAMNVRGEITWTVIIGDQCHFNSNTELNFAVNK